jgi:hypothetical protein
MATLNSDRAQIEEMHEMIGKAIADTAATLVESFMTREELSPTLDSYLGGLTTLRDGTGGTGDYVMRGSEGSFRFGSGTESNESTAWKEVNLGYSQAGMVISVTAGYLWFGTLDPITIAAADITLPNTVQDVWIYVKHAWGSVTATIESDITSLTSPAYPIDDTDYMRWPLTCWTVTKTDSVYSATRKYFSHVGDIKIPLVRPT